MIHRFSLSRNPHCKCNNTPGSFECECKVGFTHELSDPTKLCLDLGSYFQIISVKNFHTCGFKLRGLRRRLIIWKHNQMNAKPTRPQLYIVHVDLTYLRSRVPILLDLIYAHVESAGNGSVVMLQPNRQTVRTSMNAKMLLTDAIIWRNVQIRQAHTLAHVNQVTMVMEEHASKSIIAWQWVVLVLVSLLALTNVVLMDTASA